MQITVEGLRALRDKYREIKRLRDQHAAGESADPRAAMAALAHRFPGALRELDELPMPIIEERLAALDASIADPSAAPEWARLQIAYHGSMRAALRIKRIAGRAGDDAGVLHAIASAYVPAADEPPLSSFDGEAIAAIARPVGGRLNPWVFQRVASACGVSVETVRRALFSR